MFHIISLTILSQLVHLEDVGCGNEKDIVFYRVWNGDFILIQHSTAALPKDTDRNIIMFMLLSTFFAFFKRDSERSIVKFGQTANHSVVLRNRMFTYMMGKKYACVICGKMFSMKGNLSVHMLIHTGERPHQCELCLKVFRHRNSLNRHKRSRHMSDCPA